MGSVMTDVLFSVPDARSIPLIRPRYARPPSPTRGEGIASADHVADPRCGRLRSAAEWILPSPLVGEGGRAGALAKGRSDEGCVFTFTAAPARSRGRGI